MSFFSWLKGLVGGGLFSKFSLSEKRDLLTWNLVVLEGEKGRRKGTVAVKNFTGSQKLAERLSDAELDRLIEIRRVMGKADSTNGPKAIELYKQVAKLAPWDEICLMSIGVEYAQAGKFSEAIPWLEKAQALNPSNSRVRENLQNIKAAAKRR